MTGTGEWWRLLSAHLVHLGTAHMLLNVVGLGLLYLLFAPLLTLSSWALGTLLSALAVSLGLLVASPEISWYVGLSGVLHGLFAVGLVAMSRSERRLAIGLAAGLVVKLIWEQLAGPVPGSAMTAGGPVVVDAHLYGAIGGWLASLVLRLAGRLTPSV